MRENWTGFTLIELIIVIAIIGVLSTVILTAINPAHYIASARDSRRKTDLKSIQQALEAYRTANGKYPVEYVSSVSNSPWIPELVNSGDLKTIPTDPANPSSGCSDPSTQECYTYNANLADGAQAPPQFGTCQFFTNGNNYEMWGVLESQGPSHPICIKVVDASGNACDIGIGSTFYYLTNLNISPSGCP